MNKVQLGQWWEHFRSVNGISLRAVQALPKDKVEAKPCKDMRTPKELVVHMYNGMRSIGDGITKGEIAYGDEADARTAAGIRSHDELVRFAVDSWKATDASVRSLSDERIMGIVKTPWGKSYPGFVCVQILYDEHLHHRGQLYAYLRQLGIEPPSMWSFEDNAPEFRPRVAATQKV
ncbi:MAG TPA: DinB family protein [Candidatus Eisenbacteria bacterium]|nr:DinB family protein [Candidatus Eisenbacteria bacterium]